MKSPGLSAPYEVPLAPPNSSKKRKSTSAVWNHFRRETDESGMERAVCTSCGKRFSGSSKDGTTHLRNHLKSSKCKRSQKETISASKTGGLENPTVTNGNFVFDEERVGLDLVRMIIKNGYLLNMVEHEDFKIFIKNLQPMFKLPSQDTLMDKIRHFYKEEKEKLRRQLDKVLSFSLILNFWTDCGKKSKYCSFTLQFIEDGPKLMKKNIAIKNVENNYSGETLCGIVKDVLLEWNIDKKLTTITIESSSANDEMVGFLKGWLHHKGNCHPFRNLIYRIPCITHVINLLVKDGLDEIDYILHKIRKAIKYMRETTIGKQKLEEVVKKLNLGGKDITSEGVPLRWDSTFFMLQIALELRRQGEAFFDLQSSDCVFPLNLSVEEWDMAKGMHNWLNFFYKGICSFLGSKGLRGNVYLSMIFGIYGRLHQWQKSDIVKKMQENFFCYFDDMSFVSAIVAVFDPRTKLDFVEYLFNQHSSGISERYKMLNAALNDLFNLYDKYLTGQRSSSSFINDDNSSSSDGDDPCHILDEWKKWKRQRTELEKYLQEPLQPDEEFFDILGWWHTKSQDSPTLWTMARDILAIPMSTSTSNSAFCIETMTLDPIFNDLDPDIIEALFCGKDWLDNPIRITPNKDNGGSTVKPEPILEISGSTLGLELLPTFWALQEKRDPANTEFMLASASSCIQPLPTKELQLVDEEIMNMFKPYTEMEKIICNYIFNEDLDGSEVLFKMKYEYGDRAAFYTLRPNYWISSQIINLVVCKMTEKKRFSKTNAWYLPTHFSQKMINEDGNPKLEWFEKRYWGDDKYMSKLIYCEKIYIPMNDSDCHWYLCVIDLMSKGCIYIFDSLPSTTRQDIRTRNVETVVTGLDKLLTYLEKDNYTNSITKFQLKSPTSNLIQSNGYDCGVYVIMHMYAHFDYHLPFMETWSKHLRYKLASNLVLSTENEKHSEIKENAGKIPLRDDFQLLK